MRSLWAAALLLRRLRTEIGIAALIFVLVAGTSFLFAAGPRLLNAVADDALRYAVRVAAPLDRNINLSLVDSLSPGDGGIGGVREYGDRLSEEIPPSILALAAEQSVRVTTVRFLATDPPSYETHISLRYQDGLTDATRLVAGRWPVDRGGRLPVVMPSDDDDPVILEMALSSGAAAEIGVRVGDRLAVVLDRSDLLLRGSQVRLGPLELEIVGLYEALDPNAASWDGDRELLEVSQHGDDENPVAFVMGYIPAELYPSVWDERLQFQYTWRYMVDPARLDASQAGRLAVDLRRLGLLASTGIDGSNRVLVVSGLPRIVDRFIAQLGRTETVLAAGAVGPFGLAAGAVAMVAVLLADRRRPMHALARGRGASGALVLGAELWEAMLLAGGASLVGLLAAEAAVPARDSPLSPALAALMGATTAVLLVGATWPAARRPLRLVERDDVPLTRIAPRRLVIETMVVGLALAAALLLRERGIGSAAGVTTGAPGVAAGADPLLASVPVLAGVAAGTVALRLYPLPVRALGWLAARTRGFVAVTGLRRVARQGPAANLPLLVLTLTAAFASFASVVTSSLERGQVDASYLEIGADYRLQPFGGGVLPPSVDPAAIPGVEAVAGGMLDAAAAIASTTTQQAAIFLASIEPVDYQAVTAGTAADPRWPSAFLEPPAGDGIGTARNPIPAILSTQLPMGSADLNPGDTFRLAVRGEWFTFRMAERRASFPGLAGRSTFVVVPFNWLQTAFAKPVSASVLWLRAGADAAEPIATAITAARGSVTVVSRHAVYAAQRDAPLIEVVGTGYGFAVALAAGYMALTIVGAMILSATRRTRDLAFLRTLGVSAGQGLGLVLVEHAPPVLLGILPGALLGVGVAILTEPGLGLSTFIGSPEVHLYVDWRAIGLLIVLLLGVVAVAIAAGTWLSRRVTMVDALRMGEH